MISSIVAAILVSGAASAATFIVTNTNDSGVGSLRQALVDANSAPGLDTIAFLVPGSGIHTILPSTELPHVTSPVVIDGTTQPGYADHPLIELTGAYQRSCGLCLDLGSDGSTIRGLVIGRFTYGIHIIGSSRNTISANYIGTTADGAATAGNSGIGVWVSSASNNVIGGVTRGTGNLISGSTTGIQVTSSTGTVIAGNLIGMNASGTSAMGDTFDIEDEDDSTGTVIGGTTVAARNVIAGSMYLFGDETVVKGNYVGTDITGMIPLANSIHRGIANSGTGHTIGGTTAPERNVIVGGSGGAIIFEHYFRDPNPSRNHTVLGNFIGVAADGVTTTRWAYGIVVRDTSNVVIGGVEPGAGNFIAAGPYTGVTVHGNSTSISIRSNAISGMGIGISLNEYGPTANDPGDADSGPNNLQNYPVIRAVTASVGVRRRSAGLSPGLSPQAVTISGVLDSRPSTIFDLDFYDSDICGKTGNRWVGSTRITTDETGHAIFAVTARAWSTNISATATDSSGNTSEFSGCAVTDPLLSNIPTLEGSILSLLGVALLAIAMARLHT